MWERRTELEVRGRDVDAAKLALGHKEYEVAEMATRGFCLRVRKRSLTWCLRGRLLQKQSTWRVGDAMRMPVEKARENAREALKLLERGIDPKAALHEWENDGPRVRTGTPADGWTWKQGVAEYLEEGEKTQAEATRDFYRYVLLSEHLAFLKDKLLKEITPADGRRAQDEIYRLGHPQMARKTLQAMKTFMKWAANRHGSGIEVSPIAGLEPRKLSKYERSPEGHVPSPEQLGQLPWRLEAADIAPQARLAGLLALLTVQRIRTVLRARKAHFEPKLDGGLWNVPWPDMKAKRPHVVPLPPATWDIVRQAMALWPDSEWLFPQVRPRRRGGPCDGHVTYHPVADPMDPLDPHDLRRGFATHGEHLLGISEAHTKAILHHAEGKSGDVTKERYALHDGTHFKWDVMRTWERWIQRLAMEQAPVPGARLRTLALTGAECPAVHLPADARPAVQIVPTMP